MNKNFSELINKCNNILSNFSYRMENDEAREFFLKHKLDLNTSRGELIGDMHARFYEELTHGPFKTDEKWVHDVAEIYRTRGFYKLLEDSINDKFSEASGLVNFLAGECILNRE